MADLLKMVSDVLGKAYDASHLALINHLAGQVLADPRDHDTAGIFHDALRDADVEPHWGTHPSSWQGMQGAQEESHPLHGAYNAARRHSMYVHLDPLHANIEEQQYPDAELHRMAANVATLFGEHDLAASHMTAHDQGYAPAYHPGLYRDGYNRDIHLATVPHWHWDQGTYNMPNVLPADLHGHLPEFQQQQSSRIRYATKRDAWNAYHQAHAAWMRDATGTP